MTLLTNVQSLQLPVFMAIGVAGFVFCLVADGIKNRDLKAAASESPLFDDDGNVMKKPLKHRELLLGLNIAGYICMFASLIALWHYGYFDPYIGMLFG